jgi:hypothetical protein
MMKEELIERPVLEVPVHCGKVSKADIRRLTNATWYELELAMKAISETDKTFEERYLSLKKAWSLPEDMAMELVMHLYPGYRIRVVLT